MPCDITKDESGQVTRIVCSRRSTPKCKFCGKPSSKLCDYPVGTGTCDAQICRACTTHIEPDTDYCPNHKDAGTQ